jgi:hypothetical protein
MGSGELKTERAALDAVATSLRHADAELAADGNFVSVDTDCVGASAVISAVAGVCIAHDGMLRAIRTTIADAAMFPNELAAQIDAAESKLASAATGRHGQ